MPGHVRRAHVELRAVVREERRVTTALLLLQDVHLRLELRVRRHRPRLGQDLTALDLVLLDPAKQTPRCCRPPGPGPAACGTSPRPSPPSCACRVKPTISTSSPTFTIPRSTRPVATVPRPLIENTSSTAIRNGLSMSRTGSGICVSSAVDQLVDRLLPLRVPVERRKRRAADHRRVVPVELVLRSEARGPPSPPGPASPGRRPRRTC